MGKSAVCVLVAALAACGTAPKRAVEVGFPEAQVGRAFADSLAAKGHFLAFKRAFELYRGLYSKPSVRAGVATAYVRTGLLLALRERQIGIDAPGTLAEVDKVVGENPSLAGYAAPALIISAIPPRTRGVMKDISTETWSKAGRDALQAAEDAVRSRAASDEFSAAVLAAWSCAAGRFSEKWRDPAEYLKLFPGSLLLKYEAAICGESDATLLREILAAEPEFAEAHYHLGEAAIAEKKLFEAEGQLLDAAKALPESPQPPLLLAGITFATEEFAASLDFYDRTLELSPEYRDALLGKAITLAYLKRYDESMAVLERMIDLGFWLLGESHYWMAWDLRALGRLQEARRHVDEAKSRLQTNPHVFSLAGEIALALEELDRAENDFREALKYDQSNTESLFGLGTIYSRQGRWGPAAEAFEKAGRASDAEGQAVAAAIEDLRTAAIVPDRKARLVGRRTAQLERLRFDAATGAYDAAAAYFNSGARERALALAALAAEHPALKAKAEELIRSIKK